MPKAERTTVFAVDDTFIKASVSGLKPV